MSLYINAALPILLLLSIAAWEMAMPCRRSEMSRLYRWVNMGAMRICGKIFFRLLMPISLSGLALWCAKNEFGLFNFFTLPPWLLLVATVLLLDFSSYLMHVAAHHNQFLWRAHGTHHLDTEFDVTTALRTHPFDDLLNVLAEGVFIILLGLSSEGVLIYAVVSGVIAKFSHANVEIPDRVDQILRWFIVTPNMHRIHHSATRRENDSNYSGHFTLWDHIFGTHRPYPEETHSTMKIGQHVLRDPHEIRVDRLLMRPFRNYK